MKLTYVVYLVQDSNLLQMPGKPGTACPRVCRVEGCGRALTGMRTYFKRVRICPEHHAADVIATSNGLQRFCQKCGRLQALEAFTGSRRSCARKLEVHNLNLKRKRGPLVSYTVTPQLYYQAAYTCEILCACLHPTRIEESC